MESSENPKISERKIPLWIKVMWAFGVIWIAIYVVRGLQSTPSSW